MLRLSLLFGFLLALVTAQTPPAAQARATSAVVPRPRIVVPSSGVFPLPATATVSADVRDGGAARFLATYLRGVGVTTRVQRRGGTIALTSNGHDRRLGAEGYTLDVDDRGVRIGANGPAGVFYGVQTLEQMVPVRLRPPAVLPHIHIADWPEYRWRGIHLDVARRFFPVDVVERYIDLAARFKLNTFHWHLTDDEAWRLSVRRYPALTAPASCSGSTARCGYYTERDVRAIVAYAGRRFVTVVPEIDLPAHADALLHAYPGLACDGAPAVLCPSDRTFAFLRNVLAATAGLFPSAYLHVGGDEVPEAAWDGTRQGARLCHARGFCTTAAIQGYIVRRLQAMARHLRRHLVVWDDVVAGRPERDAVVMAWHDRDAAAHAARLGYDTVVVPQDVLYFDAYQGDPRDEPRAFGGVTTLHDVYAFDPMPPGLSSGARRRIAGVQGNLWTTYVPDADRLWYMLLPRELALAEIGWTPTARRRWGDFLQRIQPQLRRLKLNGYGYRPPS